jgi:hypothetical protein
LTSVDFPDPEGAETTKMLPRLAGVFDFFANSIVILTPAWNVGRFGKIHLPP